MIKRRLEGKVAIVTGAGSGIGEATMTLFASHGVRVVGTGRTLTKLERVLAGIQEAGGEGIALAADLSEEGGAERIVAAALATFGAVDILVHAAGVGPSWTEVSPGSMNDLVTTSPEKWREGIRINLDSAYYCCHAVLPHMLAQGSGAIVNVASIGGLMGMAGAHTYTAAKAGVINLTRSLCTTYAKDGIRVNCLAPGHIDTPMTASVMDRFDDPQIAEALCPMQRPGTAMEMAHACLFLASEEASFCNGTILVADGGTTARL